MRSDLLSTRTDNHIKKVIEKRNEKYFDESIDDSDTMIDDSDTMIDDRVITGHESRKQVNASIEETKRKIENSLKAIMKNVDENSTIDIRNPNKNIQINNVVNGLIDVIIECIKFREQDILRKFFEVEEEFYSILGMLIETVSEFGKYKDLSLEEKRIQENQTCFQALNIYLETIEKYKKIRYEYKPVAEQLEEIFKK